MATTIVGVFEDEAAAEAALADLQQAGFQKRQERIDSAPLEIGIGQLFFVRFGPNEEPSRVLGGHKIPLRDVLQSHDPLSLAGSPGPQEEKESQKMQLDHLSSPSRVCQ